MKKLIGTASFAVLLLAGCSESSGPKLGPPANILIQAGGGTPQNAVFGQAVAVAPTVLVTDASNQPLPGIPVTFAITAGGGTLNAPVQTTSATGTASVVWTLGNTFGTKTLTATVAGLAPVTFSATAIAPDAGVLAFNLTDPANDTLGNPSTNVPRAIDLVSLRGDFKRDSLIIVATFSRPVSAQNGSPDQVIGVVEFDIDDNATTGSEPFSNFFGASANVRVDYALIYDGGDPANLFLASESFGGPVRASFSGSTITARIPMSMLGNDDGNFTIVGVVGTEDRPTDVFPNSGASTVRRSIGINPIGSIMAEGISRPLGPDALTRWRDRRDARR